VTGADLTSPGCSAWCRHRRHPPNNPEACGVVDGVRRGGAHAGVHGCSRLRGDRAEVEMPSTTSLARHGIPLRKFELPVAQPAARPQGRPDEVVLQFTGERGMADTKIAYVSGPRWGQGDR
jgi:hypothetical protein